MSYDLMLWKAKARSRLSPGLISLYLVEGLPCPGVARFPEKSVTEALRQVFGQAPDDLPFELYISKSHMAVGLPFSQAQELSPRIQSLAKDHRLVVYDPQVSEPSAEDQATFEEARNPLDADSPSNDFPMWLEKAESGDLASMNKVASAYRYGSGVIQDLAQALSWYERASDLGYLPSLVNLAECHANGEGTPRNIEEAVRLYTEAMKGEQCVAPFELAKLYQSGDGVEQSVERAAELYRLARKNGHPEAYVALKKLGLQG